MPNRSIALVGLSGTGKSTIGRLLATDCGLTLLDTDALIEVRAGQPIPAIFSQLGEEAFRDIETAVLQAAFEGGKPHILATGGGIILRSKNRALLREKAFVVWLDAPTESLVARLEAHDQQRPLLGKNMAMRLDALRAMRAPFYAEVAHVQVETHGRTVAIITAEIRTALHKHEVP